MYIVKFLHSLKYLLYKNLNYVSFIDEKKLVWLYFVKQIFTIFNGWNVKMIKDEISMQLMVKYILMTDLKGISKKSVICHFITILVPQHNAIT